MTSSSQAGLTSYVSLDIEFSLEANTFSTVKSCWETESCASWQVTVIGRTKAHWRPDGCAGGTSWRQNADPLILYGDHWWDYSNRLSVVSDIHAAWSGGGCHLNIDAGNWQISRSGEILRWKKNKEDDWKMIPGTWYLLFGLGWNGVVSVFGRLARAAAILMELQYKYSLKGYKVGSIPDLLCIFIKTKKNQNYFITLEFGPATGA